MDIIRLLLFIYLFLFVLKPFGLVDSNFRKKDEKDIQ
jgi:hypothetical protein